MNQEKFISPLIESQFPSFYKEEGQNFIAFIKAYYEWMEQADVSQWLGSTISQSRSLLDYKDIDNTLPEFVKHFKDKYIQSLSESIISDKRLLVKHILELYRSKGTVEAHKLLFRIFFNEDIEIYTPNEHILKLSDATWYVPRYIEVTSSKYLNNLINKKIRNSGNATAVVESYYEKIVNQKTVNVLYISNIDGLFRNGELIYCDDIPEITDTNAPVIIGSLSTINIDNGGYDYKVGDLLNVQGSGRGGVVQVAAVRNESGKVKFLLENGGYGFSLDAIVTVTGGAGEGATFKVGEITDKQVYVVNTDYIRDVNLTRMNLWTEGVVVGIHGTTGHFHDNEIATASANVMHMHITYENLGTNRIGISNGEILSNTSLNINNLTVYNSVENILYITGPDNTMDYIHTISDANMLMPGGITLVSDQSQSIVRVNAFFPRRTIVGSGLVDTDVSTDTILHLYNSDGPYLRYERPAYLQRDIDQYIDDNIISSATDIGYFIPGSIITGQSSGHTAIVDYVDFGQPILIDEMSDYLNIGNDWTIYFPAASGGMTNLDSQLEDTLRWVNKIIGKITLISGINPGIGYSSNPTVTVEEPLIANLQIPDGRGNVWGNDAVVTGTAGTANGIVTAIRVKDSGFSYISNENITLESNTNPVVVSGISVIDQQGIGSGYWKNRKGFLSDEMFLIDSDYYQTYSYEIVAKKMIKTYEKFVKDLTHPAGFKLFGKYSVRTELTEQNSKPVQFIKS